ncbi:MAG: FHA domain-containing protein [Solirubrobacteraceae bacterium]
MAPPDVVAGSDPLARHSISAAELKDLIAAEREGNAFLVYRDDSGSLRHFTVADERTMSIGRRAETDLSIPWDPAVSGLHAEIQCVGGEWAIVDDGLSTNGTYVNGERLSGRQRLRDEDRIRVGSTILAYRAGRSGSTQATVAAGDIPKVSLTDMQQRVLVALCRPYRDGDTFATPATNQEIAAEVFLSVDAVKMHLRTLFGKFELTGLPQNQKRTRLAECALQFGVISLRDLA